MTEEKKKHIANRQPDNALNSGLRFDEELKAQKAAEAAKKKKLEEEKNKKGLSGNQD
jgi:hypothetical protein